MKEDILEGIITVKDTRQNLTAMQEIRKQEAQRIVSSLNGENIIDSIVDGVKTVVTVAGTVLNVVTKFIPGKADDLALILAQPAILNAIEASRGLLKGIFISKDVNQITASLVDVAGNVKDITIKDTNLVETVKQGAINKISNMRSMVK